MEQLIISISGLRGIVGESLTPQVAVEFGMAFGTFLRQNQSQGDGLKVCVGRDSRGSGSMIAAAVSSGLMAVGCETIDLGIVTTPGTALMTRFLSCRGGVVITASHNPIEWNGIKLLRGDGIAFPADQAGLIRRVFEQKQFAIQAAHNVASASSDTRAHAVHVDTVLQFCDKTLISSQRFKVVLDSINGAGCVVTAQLLSELGCEVVHMNNRPNGDFVHLPEPTAGNLTELPPEVTRHSAAVGFAQDPDADRLAVIDEKGNYIGEEYTLALAVKYILGIKKGPVAVNLSSSRMIDDLATTAGCRVIRTPVGEAHVANAMIENDCIIGGEGNGGVIDLRVVPVRDSLVGIAYILQLLAQTGKTISQLVEEIPRYHMIKTKFPCPQDKTAELLEQVKQCYKKIASDELKIDTRDGIRIDLPQGWVHLRASNTEPIMRIIAESADPKLTQRLIDEVQELAKI